MVNKLPVILLVICKQSDKQAIGSPHLGGYREICSPLLSLRY